MSKEKMKLKKKLYKITLESPLMFMKQVEFSLQSNCTIETDSIENSFQHLIGSAVVVLLAIVVFS